MGALNRDIILAADDRRIAETFVEPWGGTVCHRVLTGAERDRYTAECLRRKEGEVNNITGLRALLVLLACCDDKGDRLFTDADLDALQKKSSVALEILSEAIVKQSKLLPEAVRDAEKN